MWVCVFVYPLQRFQCDSSALENVNDKITVNNDNDNDGDDDDDDRGHFRYQTDRREAE